MPKFDVSTFEVFPSVQGNRRRLQGRLQSSVPQNLEELARHARESLTEDFASMYHLIAHDVEQPAITFLPENVGPDGLRLDLLTTLHDVLDRLICFHEPQIRQAMKHYSQHLSVNPIFRFAEKTYLSYLELFSVLRDMLVSHINAHDPNPDLIVNMAQFTPEPTVTQLVRPSSQDLNQYGQFFQLLEKLIHIPALWNIFCQGRTEIDRSLVFGMYQHTFDQEQLSLMLSDNHPEKGGVFKLDPLMLVITKFKCQKNFLDTLTQKYPDLKDPLQAYVLGPSVSNKNTLIKTFMTCVQEKNDIIQDKYAPEIKISYFSYFSRIIQIVQEEHDRMDSIRDKIRNEFKNEVVGDYRPQIDRTRAFMAKIIKASVELAKEKQEERAKTEKKTAPRAGYPKLYQEKDIDESFFEEDVAPYLPYQKYVHDLGEDDPKPKPKPAPKAQPQKKETRTPTQAGVKKPVFRTETIKANRMIEAIMGFALKKMPDFDDLTTVLNEMHTSFYTAGIQNGDPTDRDRQHMVSARTRTNGSHKCVVLQDLQTKATHVMFNTFITHQSSPYYKYDMKKQQVAGLWSVYEALTGEGKENAMGRYCQDNG